MALQNIPPTFEVLFSLKSINLILIIKDGLRPGKIPLRSLEQMHQTNTNKLAGNWTTWMHHKKMWTFSIFLIFSDNKIRFGKPTKWSLTIWQKTCSGASSQHSVALGRLVSAPVSRKNVKSM